MTTYAVGHLRNVDVNADIVAYLQKIDPTLAPFGGYFIIHGGEKTVLEGGFSSDLIVIAFPDHASAQNWYGSDAYRANSACAAAGSRGDVFLIDGVDRDHKATDILAAAS